MNHYSLEVKIDQHQLPLLKKAGYKLCIAREVDQQFTVVWKGEGFLENNLFEWTDEYRIFGQLNAQLGDRITGWTESQKIAFGQTCVLDSTGLLHPATSPAHADDHSGPGIYLQNDYGLIHVGVLSRLDGLFSPISVSPLLIGGKTEIRPSQNVRVWLDTNYTTGSFIRNASNNLSVDIPFDTATRQTIAFGSGKAGIGTWSVQALSSLSSPSGTLVTLSSFV